jgi:hypothetical protein
VTSPEFQDTNQKVRREGGAGHVSGHESQVRRELDRHLVVEPFVFAPEVAKVSIETIGSGLCLRSSDGIQWRWRWTMAKTEAIQARVEPKYRDTAEMREKPGL